ncbi:hypothetical protein EJB05_50514 [Eragrostis curvula]|uniref:RWP-RK domain-containing protein n=1 Tax=Eragrostis curvula TaxID=38414 RepID=A0A5J9SZH8_9POAL|nr:hypothetical protein EJB05_50514 [Eragrostis curvula]
MSDEGYDSNGDVGRFLLHSPLPEPHMAVAIDHQPQHVPADDHALQAPMMQEPAPATGFQGPGAIDAAEGCHAVAMEIQPPHMLATDPDQAYGFPEEPAPPLAAAAATRVDDALSSFVGMFLGDPEGQALYEQFMRGEDDLAAFNVGPNATGDAAPATGVNDALPSFEGMFHDAPESQPLNDQFMMNDEEDGLAAIFRGTDVGNASGGAAVEPGDVRPAEEHPVFVPFVHGQVDCTNCDTVWEALQESANHRHHLVLHGNGLGTFYHLITDRMYIGDGVQSTTSQQMYLDLEQRPFDWVRRFIANLVEALSDDSSGQLKHSWTTSWSADSTRSSITPPVENAAHRQLELDMLKKILHAPATNEEAVAVPQTDPDQAPHQPIIQQAVENSHDDDIFDGTSWHGLNPPTTDSSNLSVQDGESSAAEYPSLLAEQRKRLSNMSMADVIKLLHLSKEDAAKQLKISATSLQRLCRKNDAGRWPGRSINALSSKIKKLEQAALRNVGTTGLLAIKEQIDKLKSDMEEIYESLMKGIRENEMKKGAGSSGSK